MVKSKIKLKVFRPSKNSFFFVEFDSYKEAREYMSKLAVLNPFDVLFKFLNCESKR